MQKPTAAAGCIGVRELLVAGDSQGPSYVEYM
jgi:hypothetical protein